MGKILTIPNILTKNFCVKLLIYYLMVLNVKSFGLKCVCNPQECDIIRSEDCPGKGYIVWDPCKCCKVCAKTLGEACGGPGGFSGTCEQPLKCISKPPIIGTGVCLDLPDTSIQNCQETILLESGCEIVNRKCRCWNKTEVCKDKQIKWDFKNIEDCQLNLQNLVKIELDFDEDYKTSSKYLEYKKFRGRRRKSHNKKNREHKFEATKNYSPANWSRPATRMN